jgi:hypothetical protein
MFATANILNYLFIQLHSSDYAALDPPPLAPPLEDDEPAAGAAAGAAAGVAAAAAGAAPAVAGAAAPCDLLSVDGLAEEYRSAYQPPPFKIKVPPLIWRLAVRWLHFGQTSVEGSEIFCSSSQALAQEAQRYS